MRLFISSTFRDLRPERDAAREALLRSELVPWGMELFVSEPSKPLNVCLEQVQLSDAVVLVIGDRPSADTANPTPGPLSEVKIVVVLPVTKSKKSRTAPFP